MRGFECFMLVMIFLALIVLAGAVLTLCFEPEIEPEPRRTEDELLQSIAQKQQEVRPVRAGAVTEISYVKRNS